MTSLPSKARFTRERELRKPNCGDLVVCHAQFSTVSDQMEQFTRVSPPQRADLSKAFDCVNAEILIGKLSALGIQNYARDWLASYLSNSVTHQNSWDQSQQKLLFALSVRAIASEQAVRSKWKYLRVTVSCRRPLYMAYNIKPSIVGSSFDETTMDPSIKEFLSLLDSDVDMKSKDVKRRSLLHCAVRLNFEFGVDLLLDRGFDINSTSSGETPLHVAAWKRYSSIFRKLIERGADVNCQNKNGLTVLHIATIIGSLPFVDILFKEEVDVNIKDVKGNTPLHFAAKSANSTVVERLLNKGAVVDCKNDAGQLPLHIAAKYCNQRPIFQLLLSEGSEVSAKDKKGRSPLHLAAEKAFLNGAIVHNLLEWGASPLEKDDNDERPSDGASYIWTEQYMDERKEGQLC
ncbi:serine/threonine-protein phosphatase 6 regulatory ankyrin repeat subunit C-like [Homalodisca vitripennis]|uniref:serine/threonine-protein phosphatase 6 regulatory ankyrin repeat subunit C-like n=1 Tax=Homalodisca vitripennis TaxID=197043 RepID=UPI001EE9C81C|nr:serine/threonine-protein phosphatase 6 regulatory ankyrin repeat subunit C-like [Homalodisca vitripennis]